MSDEELKRWFDAMQHANAAAHAETRRHFDVLAERVEQKVQLVAEAVAQVDGKMDRETEALRVEMQRGFSETQAMIKFSHVELDRRVSRLEQGLSDLQARIERLETTTH